MQLAGRSGGRVGEVGLKPVGVNLSLPPPHSPSPPPGSYCDHVCYIYFTYCQASVKRSDNPRTLMKASRRLSIIRLEFTEDSPLDFTTRIAYFEVLSIRGGKKKKKKKKEEKIDFLAKACTKFPGSPRGRIFSNQNIPYGKKAYEK